MKIEVEVEKLLEYNITIHQYLFLQLVSAQDIFMLDTYVAAFGKFFDKESLVYLIERDLLALKDDALGYRFSNLEVTKGYLNIFDNSKSKSSSVSDWIEEWLDLFPKGVKSGGFYVKSAKSGCLNKMKSFVKNNPEYNKDTIIQATKNYIKEKEAAGWAYMQLAHFFIEKNKISTLASYCDNIEEYEEKDKFVKTLNS